MLVVSPNNPTGSIADADELERAGRALRAARRLALIGDEVFADYPLDARAAGVSVLQQSRALAFGLGGLSKSVGLPQVKVAWIGVRGPDAAVDDALTGLEIVADTYLSVSTPVAGGAAASCSRAEPPCATPDPERIGRNLEALARPPSGARQRDAADAGGRLVGGPAGALDAERRGAGAGAARARRRARAPRLLLRLPARGVRGREPARRARRCSTPAVARVLARAAGPA